MSEPLLSLYPGTTVHDDRGLLTIRHRWGRTPVGPATPPLADAMRSLIGGPMTGDELTDRLCAAARKAGLPAQPQLSLFHHALDQLGHTLQRHVGRGARAVATAVPLAPAAAPRLGPVSTGPLLLDRAAHLRPVEGEFVLESARSHFRLRVEDDRAASLVAMLTRPVSRAELDRVESSLPAGTRADFLALLVATGFAHPAGGDAEDIAGLPSGWTFHELLAFDGSRAGPRDRAYGPVFPLRGKEPPAPPCALAPHGRTVPLHRPDLVRTSREDRSFTDVLEARSSHRVFGEQLLTAEQLGTFLYRSARVRTVLDARLDDDRPYAVTSRPYPSAGSAYELEVYLAVRRCDGLDPGLYHYDPLGHALTELSDSPDAADQLLNEAKAAAGGSAVPDVHFTLVSRIKRLSWKYAAHSYVLTLKNSGVLLQTLYLVATAMGLAGCALGGGDSDTPVRAFGLDPHTETPVGAFLLGTAPAATEHALHENRLTIATTSPSGERI
ncbi:SagB family peptide dehydrogenase [Streptomyces chartreusis]|uniref:SagB family peptide dehydrogenase n=1 Tax=Streptomyces chartreusis TaxID=1969 RepID=UPI0036423628